VASSPWQKSGRLNARPTGARKLLGHKGGAGALACVLRLWRLLPRAARRSRPTRRDVLQTLGGVVVFQFVLPGAAGMRLGARLRIDGDGTVTLLTGKVELGQGARTVLTQCVAEELGVAPAKVRVIMGDTALVPDDGGTYASLTTPLTVPVVRRAAATARRMLQSMKPGEAMEREIPIQVDLTPPARWKVLGTPLANVNGRAIVTGALRYSADVKLPGMLAGKVVRPEAYQASLVRFDAEAAGKLAGVKVVREGDFLGVSAPGDAAAEHAASLVHAEWRAEELVEASALAAHFKKTSTAPVKNFATRYPPLLEKGNVERGLAASAKRCQAEYTLPFIAHTPIEPRAAVAYWDEHGLTVHGGSQVPFAVRAQLAAAFGIAERQVRFIASNVGTGFGGKHGPEVMLEAARLAKAAGKPVRVAWSREEEFVRSYCRPAALVEVRGGLSSQGRMVAWDFRNYNSGAASLVPPYDIANYHCAYHRAASPLRQGAYRSLAAVANTFARETHIEELASLAGQDPVEFRLRNIANARLREAVERAAERFGWGKTREAAGLACNIEKDAHLALFVALEIAGGRVKLRRMVVAFDCGAVLNPDNLRNQITGATIMGLGGALFEELRYDARKVVNNSISAYRVPRFSDVPPIEVILIDRRDVTPAGAGESPITVVAPAIGAALHRATKRWFRSLPFEKALD
jgi:nicotinate dehydrogenase subunit B